MAICEGWQNHHSEKKHNFTRISPKGRSAEAEPKASQPTMKPAKARRHERRGIARALAAAREAATSLSAVLDVASVARARALAAATEVATPTSVAVAAAIRSTDTKWQQFNDTNLAELARQKALAERCAEEADATLCPVFDGARHAMFTVARLADAAKEGNKLIAKTGEAASKVLRSLQHMMVSRSISMRH